jgi:acetyltransferase-like isoleucine patch superfamily enzyme
LKEIRIPKVDSNTEKVLINRWLVQNFEFAEANAVIAIIETSKATFEISAPASGYVYSDIAPEEFTPITQPLGYIFDTLEECKKFAAQCRKKRTEDRTKKSTPARATKKASAKAAQLNVSLNEITKKGLITEKDVLEHVPKTPRRAKLYAPPLEPRKALGIERVLLLCGGRSATQVIEIAQYEKQKRIVGILDDTPEKWGTTLNGIPICGPTHLLKKLFDEKKFDSVIIAISTSVAARDRFRTTCIDSGIPLSNAIHPTAFISSGVTLGTGNIICAFCHFGNDTIIGDNNFISAFNSYDHHNVIGNNISTGPGCMVSGSVTIGDNVRFGAGIFVEPLLVIGHDVAIASGSIITTSIEPESVVKRKLNSIIVSKKEGF